MIEESVVLVDATGDPVGSQPKTTVHHASTPLHLAFSLHVFDHAGRTLLTRRASTKATWPGVWTNSCCGHPSPGEQLAEAVRRRARHELGVEIAGLTCVLPAFAYSATDASGIQENEICPVYAGRLAQPPDAVRANPEEVMDWAWVTWVELTAAIRATPFVFSPWVVEQVRQLPDSPCP